MILYNMMKKYADLNALSFHTPGHKGKLTPLDITELDIEGVGSTNSFIEQAEKMTADYYGAYKTHYLVGGTTSGVLTLLDSIPKGRIIVGRASHKSIFNGCILSNIEPIIVENEIVNGISTPITSAQVEKTLRANPDAIGAFITSPNYFGQVSDLARMRKVLKDKLFLVDSAHGAHCGAHPTLPENANRYADACVLSAHKTLPALTQAAYMNINNPELYKSVENILRLTRTTSPSFLLLASLEYGTHYLKENAAKFGSLVSAINRLIPERVKNSDPTRIVIDLKPYGISGYTADYFLQREGIFCEFGNPRYIIFIATVMDEVEDIEKLAIGLKKLYASARDLEKTPVIDIKKIRTARAMNFTEASKLETEYLPLRESLNRISAVEAGLFPPCLPVIARGEIISEEVIEILSKNNSFGLSEGKILVIK